MIGQRILKSFFSCSYYVSLDNILTLDPTTLFFWDLSNVLKKAKCDTPVMEWGSTLPKKAKDASHTSKHSLHLPLLTNQLTLMTSSICTYDQNNLLPPQIHIKLETKDDHPMFLNEDGQLFVMDGISNRDEVDGEECMEAIKSSPKGSGIRLKSKVRFQVC